jgi:demethylmenaquinone methyltransferase / 2-methoxy-6-polyprenyl-1,4-benzoquinol methylase
MKVNEYRGPDSHRVQQMFAGIAHRYDFLNHFLSASIDRRWRNTTVAKVHELIQVSSSTACLDACSGTGDLAIALHRSIGNRIIAADFCHPMLTRAAEKVASAGMKASIHNVEADALDLPFSDRSFDAITIAFGLRNLESPVRGLTEIHRLLRPGGAAVILEFSKPVIPVFRNIFGFYFRYVLPRLGAAISGDATAYQYLPDSVARFPTQKELVEVMRSVGFLNVGYRNLSGGIAALHWGVKQLG